LLPVCRAMYLRYWAENFRGCVGLVNLDCQGVYIQFLFKGRFRGPFLCLTLLPVYSFHFLSYSSKILALGSCERPHNWQHIKFWIFRVEVGGRRKNGFLEYFYEKNGFLRLKCLQKKSLSFISSINCILSV
jgi:hypothetical protein